MRFKRRTEKTVPKLMLAVVLAAALAGCGSAGQAETEPVYVEESVTEQQTTADATVEETNGGSSETTEAESESETVTEATASGSVIENTGTVDPINIEAGTEVEPDGDIDRYFQVYEISDELYASMVGRSFTEGGQVSRYELRYIRVLYVDFEEKTRIGEMVVHEDLAQAALGVFRDLYEVRYQICKMVLVDRYYDGIDPDDPKRGDKCDNASIAEDNTSAFNYRVRSNNASLLSPHAYGYAIDFNPFENPYVFDDGTVDGPPGSEIYADRSWASEENHMLTRGDTAVTIFWNHGFVWGGDWNVDKDYQHFDYVG